jgi:hypothetical protein
MQQRRHHYAHLVASSLYARHISTNRSRSQANFFPDLEALRAEKAQFSSSKPWNQDRHAAQKTCQASQKRRCGEHRHLRVRTPTSSSLCLTTIAWGLAGRHHRLAHDSLLLLFLGVENKIPLTGP